MAEASWTRPAATVRERADVFMVAGMLVDRIESFPGNGEKTVAEDLKRETGEKRENKRKEEEKREKKRKRKRGKREEGWGCFLGGVVFIQAPPSFSSSCPEKMNQTEI